MNCRRFEDLREEFLDGTLSSGDQATAEEHLASCSACAEGLRQRQQFGGRVTEGLQQTAQSLRLRPEVERRILREWACESTKDPTPRWAERFAGRLIWRWAAAAVFVAAVIWMTGRFRSVQNITGRNPEATDEGIVVEVSYRAPVHAFQTEGEFVRDSLDYETVTVNTRLGPDIRPASPPIQ